MIALRRRDVAEFNALGASADGDARSARRGATHRSRSSEFAAGDRVVCLRNSDALGVKNGTRGTVESVDRNARTLTVSTDRGDRVQLTSRYLGAGHLRHAYALTGHAGQGVTVDRAFVLGLRRRPTPGVGLRRPLQGSHRDAAVRDGRPARAREPFPRSRRPRRSDAGRSGAGATGGRAARDGPPSGIRRGRARRYDPRSIALSTLASRPRISASSSSDARQYWTPEPTPRGSSKRPNSG